MSTAKVKIQSIFTRWDLLLISFIEGGAVMAIELVGAKMVAPFYGNSLYVWAAVLAITLGGLTAGYFWGGTLSEKKGDLKTLNYIVIATSLLIMIMPVTAPLIMQATLPLEIRLGITISCLVFLFPPLVGCGIVSPMIIRLLSDKMEHVGQVAGTVYAISTLGGILATFSMGFYFIPFQGLKFSALGTGILLGILPILLLIFSKKK